MLHQCSGKNVTWKIPCSSDVRTCIQFKLVGISTGVCYVIQIGEQRLEISMLLPYFCDMTAVQKQERTGAIHVWVSAEICCILPN